MERMRHTAHWTLFDPPSPICELVSIDKTNVKPRNARLIYATFQTYLHRALPFYLTFSSSAEDRIPFYEDYLKDSDFEGFLTSTRAFLDANPDAVENPRLCLDYLMVAKAARDLNSIDHATSLLLFTYPNSLPALHFISSFERGSPKLTELLKGKARNGDLSSQAFANSFCRAILFIARSQGPELLQDSSLRLQTYLLAQKAEVEEIQSSTSKALEELRKGNNVLNKVVSVVLDSGEPLEKLKRLATLSGSDARFCINYYLAQLSEKEARSPEVLTLSIINALFSQSPRPDEGLALIEALPEKMQNEPKFQTFLALSQHLDERSEDAIATLKKTAGDAKEGWQQTAGSFANGLEFLENRKTSLLESLGKAMDKLDRGGDALQLEVVWTKKSGNQDPVNFRVLLEYPSSGKPLKFNFTKTRRSTLATGPLENLFCSFLRHRKFFFSRSGVCQFRPLRLPGMSHQESLIMPST